MLNSKTFNNKRKLEDNDEEAPQKAVKEPEASVEKDSKKKKLKNNHGKEKARPQSLGSLNQTIKQVHEEADENVIVIKGKANPNPNPKANPEKKKKKKNKNKSKGDTDAETSVPKEKSKKESSKPPKKSKTQENQDSDVEAPKPKKDKSEKPKPQPKQKPAQEKPPKPTEESKTENGAAPRENQRKNRSDDRNISGSKSQKRESRKMKQERTRAFVNNRFARIMQSGERIYEICVSNLPKKVTEESLADYFSGCGAVKKATLEADKTKAFVEFGDPESVMNALEIDEIKWEGSFIKIEKSTKAHRPQERVLTGESVDTIFVGNINPITTEEKLKSFFESCGEIEQVRFHYAQDGKPRGFAHVKFKKPESVDRAIVKGLEPLDERILKVERSSKKATPDAAQKPKPQVRPQEEAMPIEKKPFIPDPKVMTEKDVGTIATFKGTKVKL